MWGATKCPERAGVSCIISIHAPRVGSDNRGPGWPCNRRISIHAPRVGSDPKTSLLWPLKIISIHAPRVGSDPFRPLRFSARSNFNPRSPCGERRDVRQHRGYWRSISIHAPRVGSDSDIAVGVGDAFCISIHAPRVGSDHLHQLRSLIVSISIHAPRVGSDCKNAQKIRAFL